MKRTTIITAALLGFAGHAVAQAATLSEADKDHLVKDRRGATYELESA